MIRPHLEAEGVDGGVDVPGHHAAVEELIRLQVARAQDAVADKAGADANEHGDFLDLPREVHRGRHDVGGGVIRAHDLQELHHVGGGEEMQPDDILRAFRRRGDLVHVQRRGVGGENRAGFHDAVELAENFLFEIHVLEHRFDHQIAVGQRREVERPGDAIHADVDFLRRKTAALGAALIILAHDGQAAL